MQLGQTDQAIAAFQKQIENNAYDPFAYNALGLAYERQGKYTRRSPPSKSRLRLIRSIPMPTAIWAAST